MFFGNGYLWNDQLSDAGYAELVLVCGGRLCLCMAGSQYSVFQTKKYPEKSDLAVIDHNDIVYIVGSFYRMERVVRRFCISVWNAGCIGVGSGDCGSQSSGDGRILVLSASVSNNWMYTNRAAWNWSGEI